MKGTIASIERNRGVGMIVGEDGKHYLFRRRDVCDGWFHELTEGTPVTFEPDSRLSATSVRPIRASV